MPHYANGEPAAVGHIVKGTCYSIAGQVIGVIESITSAQETCNCKVRILAQVADSPEAGRSVLMGNGSSDFSECRKLERVL